MAWYKGSGSLTSKEKTMSFNLDDFLKRNNGLLNSTQWEEYHSAPQKPKWLEDVGLNPADVLGQGDYKNYVYDKAKYTPERPGFSDPLNPPNPLQPPSPFG